MPTRASNLPQRRGLLGNMDDDQRLMLAMALASAGQMFGSDGRGGGQAGFDIGTLMRLSEARKKREADTAEAAAEAEALERRRGAVGRMAATLPGYAPTADDQLAPEGTRDPYARITPQAQYMRDYLEAAAVDPKLGLPDPAQMLPQVFQSESQGVLEHNRLLGTTRRTVDPAPQNGVITRPGADGTWRAESVPGYNQALAGRAGAEEYAKGPNFLVVTRPDGGQDVVPTARGIAPEGMPPQIPAPPAAAPAPPDGTAASPMAGVDQESLDALTRMIATEAIGEGPEGMAAAGHVALNRLKRGHMGARTIRDVVYARNQFEGMSRADRVTPQQYARAQAVAAGLLRGEIPDPTNGAVNFINPELQAQMGRRQPTWAPLGQGQRIGNHVFYGGRPAAPGRQASIPDPVRYIVDPSEGQYQPALSAEDQATEAQALVGAPVYSAPRPVPATVERGPGGSTFTRDRKGDLQAVQDPVRAPRVLTPRQAQGLGLDPRRGPYQVTSDGQVVPVAKSVEPGVAEGAKARAADDQAALKAATDGSRLGADLIQDAQRVKELLRSGTPTGTAAGLRTTLGKTVGEGLGWMPGVPTAREADNLQEFDRIAAGGALANVDKLKGPMSDKDIAFLKSMAISSDNSVEANRRTAQHMEWAGKRATAYEAALSRWTDRLGSPSARNPKGQTFVQFWNQWAGENLPRPGLRKRAPSDLPQKRGQTQGQGWRVVGVQR